MFGLFKKKSKKEKLNEEYKKLLKQAFDASKYNRKKSDELTYQANKILEEIEKLD